MTLGDKPLASERLYIRDYQPADLSCLADAVYEMYKYRASGVETDYRMYIRFDNGLKEFPTQNFINQVASDFLELVMSDQRHGLSFGCFFKKRGVCGKCRPCGHAGGWKCI